MTTILQFWSDLHLPSAAIGTLFGTVLGAILAHLFTKSRSLSDRRRAFIDAIQLVHFEIGQSEVMETKSIHAGSIKSVRDSVARITHDVRKRKRALMIEALNKYCDMDDNNFRTLETGDGFKNYGAIEAQRLLEQMMNCGK